MTKNKITDDYALTRYSEMFKIVDISNEIVTAIDEEHAKKIHETQDFDRVPIEDNDGNIKEYYDTNATGTNKIIKIESSDLISESTGILETLKYLSKKHFYFILTGNRITHIIHYSDLNNPIVLPGIYTQVAYCEIAIRDYAREKNKYGKTDSDIEKLLEDVNANSAGLKIDIGRAKTQLINKRKNQIETNLLDELYFNEELILFRELSSMLNGERFKEFRKCVNLDDTTIASYNTLRNDIMHSNYQIIEKQSHDIKELATFIETCQKIISYIERMSE
ncbi:hypothetical protein [Ferroplasma sp.]|uniref:hypothetical protein n=1 Tax=Ferroplasma sp. TaxID=2591003 RepID=UPI00262A584B|nr:hypothetical protein [Ferroplasma sp.]